MKTLKALKLNTNITCEELSIPNTLEALQKEVGGYIEIPYLSKDLHELNIDMIINEEGKLLDMEPTLAIMQGHEVVEIVCGPVVFASHNNDGDTVSLNAEQVAYLNRTVFKAEAVGLQMGDELKVIRYINI